MASAGWARDVSGDTRSCIAHWTGARCCIGCCIIGCCIIGCWRGILMGDPSKSQVISPSGPKFSISLK